MTIKVGEIYSTTNYGDLVVTQYISAHKIEVQFIDTGFKTFARAQALRNGQVKDKMKPHVFGAGYIGDGNYTAKYDGEHSKHYRLWHSMIQRCYDENMRHKNKTYNDCFVCDEWLNYQTFAKWVDENLPDGEGWELDKDIIKKGNRIYGPQNCKFVQKIENVRASVETKPHLVDFALIDPDGNLHTGRNLEKFCREHGLTRTSISRLKTGTRKHHKGWKLAPSDK